MTAKLKLLSADATAEMVDAAYDMPNVMMGPGDEWQAMWAAAPTAATDRLVELLEDMCGDPTLFDWHTRIETILGNLR